MPLVAAIILMLVAVVSVARIPHPEWNYRIFENISELDKLDGYVVEDREDPYLGTAVPLEHYCKLIAYEGKEYLVAGYTFESLLDTLRFYQCNIWDKRLNPLIDDGTLDPSFWNEGFDSYATLGKRKLACYYETNALLIESRSANFKQFEAFQQWLTGTFTTELPLAAQMAEFYEETVVGENGKEEASA